MTDTADALLRFSFEPQLRRIMGMKTPRALGWTVIALASRLLVYIGIPKKWARTVDTRTPTPMFRLISRSISLTYRERFPKQQFTFTSSVHGDDATQREERYIDRINWMAALDPIPVTASVCRGKVARKVFV